MKTHKEVKMLKVLIVDEDTQFTSKVENTPKTANLDCTISNELSKGLWLMLEFEYDIVILDFDMLESLGDDIIEFLAIVQNLNHQKLVLTTKSSPTSRLVMEMMKNGIDSFVSKPMEMETFYHILADENTTRDPENPSFFN